MTPADPRPPRRLRRLYSIKTRVLGGFLAMLLLQGLVAVAVWRVENQVDASQAAAVIAGTAAARVTTVISDMTGVQLRLANYLRSGAPSGPSRTSQPSACSSSRSRSACAQSRVARACSRARARASALLGDPRSAPDRRA